MNKSKTTWLNYASFDISLLVYKMGGRGGEGRGGGAYLRGGDAYIDFQPIGGAVIRRGRLFEGGANSKIYGIQTWCSLYLPRRSMELN